MSVKIIILCGACHVAPQHSVFWLFQLCDFGVQSCQELQFQRTFPNSREVSTGHQVLPLWSLGNFQCKSAISP